MKRFYWFTFSDRPKACAWETEEEARKLADAAGTVTKVQLLGYPARPRLDDSEGWRNDQFPSFCYRPDLCARDLDDPRAGSCACPGGKSCSS